MSYKVRLLIRYDGTDFEGWQRQPEGRKTVQAEIEKALSFVLNEKITLVGSGRTDSGVHARGQNAHFTCENDPTSRNLAMAVNSQLPSAIAVQKAWLAPKDYHAQISAISKTYKYHIHNSAFRDPLRYRFHTWFKKPLDLQKLQAYSELLLGEQDFKSFQSAGTEVRTTVRKITEAHWTRPNPEELCFQVSGTGFLKQMVRNIVGTLIHLENKNEDLTMLKSILEAKDRQKAWGTAPAQGLILHQVYYPEELDNECREI